MYMTNSHVIMAPICKTQKIRAKWPPLGPRGPNENRFCNWLGTRGVGGNTLLQYLQHFLCDIRLLIV